VTRIALVPSAYPPSLGGVQELTRHLALALMAAGDEVEVWTQQDDGVGHPTLGVADGVQVRRFPFPLPRAQLGALPSLALGAAATLRALRQATRSFRPDVLHVQCFGPNGAYATALSCLTRVPLIVTLQGETVMDDHDAFDISTTLRTALRVGLRRAVEVTGCSQYTLADAEARFGLAPGRGNVIFNGVVVADQAAVPALLPAALVTASGRYVLALGRVVEKKGFDLLIRAFATIAGRHPDVDLVIGGTGPAEAVLSRLSEELGISGRVRLVGRLSRAEVAAAMGRAEMFVMPSRLEPFGIVVLEAWRAGRATVATSRGGPAEFVEDNQDGILVDPFDIPALADALDRVLRDSAFRSSLGDAARRRVEDFDWSVIAGQYRRLYTTAVGGLDRM
jgi:glycogen synthase